MHTHSHVVLRNLPPKYADQKHSGLSCIWLEVCYRSYTVEASPLHFYEDVCFFQREGMSQLGETILKSWTLPVKDSPFLKIPSAWHYKPWGLPSPTYGPLGSERCTRSCLMGRQTPEGQSLWMVRPNAQWRLAEHLSGLPPPGAPPPLQCSAWKLQDCL